MRCSALKNAFSWQSEQKACPWDGHVGEQPLGGTCRPHNHPKTPEPHADSVPGELLVRRDRENAASSEMALMLSASQTPQRHPNLGAGTGRDVAGRSQGSGKVPATLLLVVAGGGGGGSEAGVVTRRG